MQIDIKRVTDTILACEVSSTAREMASPLVDAFLRRLDTFPETRMKIVAVERLWHLWLDEHTLLVGVIDFEGEDEHGTLLGEWKTRRAPKLKKDGTAYQGDDEAGWLEEISSGPQLAIYALSQPGARIMVRAAVKSTPVAFWPAYTDRGIFTFTESYLSNVKAALLSKAAQIRAARTLPQPYQLTGMHCTNMYRRVCEFKQTICDRMEFPQEPPPFMFDPNNPAYPAVKEALKDYCMHREDVLVVLSASGYQDACQCIQKHHLVNGGFYPKEATVELETGTVYHAALANIYTQIKESQ